MSRLRAKVGDNDHFTLCTMSNLGIAYTNQSKYSDAEALFKQCLAKRKLVLGESHPSTLKTMNNLANTYKHSEAEVL